MSENIPGSLTLLQLKAKTMQAGEPIIYYLLTRNLNLAKMTMAPDGTACDYQRKLGKINCVPFASLDPNFIRFDNYFFAHACRTRKLKERERKSKQELQQLEQDNEALAEQH